MKNIYYCVKLLISESVNVFNLQFQISYFNVMFLLFTNKIHNYLLSYRPTSEVLNVFDRINFKIIPNYILKYSKLNLANSNWINLKMTLFSNKLF